MNDPSRALEQMIGDLVGTPSVSCVDPTLDMGNRDVAGVVADWLDGLGFEIDLLPVDEDRGKVNLVAVRGSGTGGLVMAGHLDTVPWDDGRWARDPFSANRDGDRLYGLGTADMKSFFAVTVAALRDLDLDTLTAPLIVLGTADEESSMSGARALQSSDLRESRHALIGEPTSMRPVNVHKGVMMETIRVIGKSGHSSDPACGRSALVGMHRVISVLLEMQEELRAVRDERFAVPFPTLNIGAIHGGDNPNRICGECEIHMDLRPIPGMSVTETRDSLRQRAAEALAGSDLEMECSSVFDGVEALNTGPDSEIVQAAHEMTGEEPVAAAFATEAPYLNALGMETVVLGPGNISQAHQPDEYLELAPAVDAVSVYSTLVRRFCMAG